MKIEKSKGWYIAYDDEVGDVCLLIKQYYFRFEAQEACEKLNRQHLTSESIKNFRPLFLEATFRETAVPEPRRIQEYIRLGQPVTEGVQ